MKALLVQPTNELFKYYNYLLDGAFDFEYTKAHTPHEAISIINNNPSLYKLIIADTSFKEIDALVSLIDGSNVKLPLVLTFPDNLEAKMAQKYHYDPLRALFKHNSNPNDIFDSLEKIFKIASTRDQKNEYCKIRIEFFSKTQKVQSDVYIKLSKKKYVKIIKENIQYDPSEVLRYKEKGVYFFYVKSSNFSKIFNNFVSKLTEDFENDYTMIPNIGHLYPTFCHEVLAEFVSTSGLNDQAVKLADMAISMTLHLIDANPKLTEIWQGMINGQNYLSDHSIMTCYMAVDLCRNHPQMANDENYLSLTLASFFHDIMIHDSELAQIDLASDDISELTDKQKQIIINHPLEAVAQLSDVEGIPLDVLEIIEQHHELPDGTGFPKKIKEESIGNLTIIFQVAHDFVSDLYSLRSLESGTVKNLLQEYSLKYSSTKYKTTLESLDLAIRPQLKKVS